MSTSKYFILLMHMIFSFSANASLITNTLCCIEGSGGTITRPNGEVVKLTADIVVNLGDIVQTFNNSSVQFRLSNNSYITLGENATIIVDQELLTPIAKPNPVVRLIKGTMRVITNFIIGLNPDKFRVRTSMAVTGWRGTTVEVTVDNTGNNEVALFEGGPVDIGLIQDWALFDDSLFTDPLKKELTTMDTAAFTAVALLQNMTLDEFLVGANPTYALNDPMTAMNFDGVSVSGPYQANPSVLAKPCSNCIPVPEPAILALFSIGLAGIAYIRLDKRGQIQIKISHPIKELL